MFIVILTRTDYGIYVLYNLFACDRGGRTGQRVRGPTLSMKFEKWTSKCEWYSWGSGGLPPGKILEALRWFF